MSDEWSEHIRQARRRRLAEAAGRDAQVALLRRVWEGIKPEDRLHFVQALVDLDQAQEAISRLSGFRLDVGNVRTSDMTDAPTDFLDADPLNREIDRLRRPVYVSPGELMLMVAAWERGDDYSPGPDDPLSA